MPKTKSAFDLLVEHLEALPQVHAAILEPFDWPAVQQRLDQAGIDYIANPVRLPRHIVVEDDLTLQAWVVLASADVGAGRDRSLCGQGETPSPRTILAKRFHARESVASPGWRKIMEANRVQVSGVRNQGSGIRAQASAVTDS